MRIRAILRGVALGLVGAAIAAPAWAGPPYVADDPQPTDNKHYEVYLFHQRTLTRDGSSGASGIDFNYGAAEGVQLTAVLPLADEHPTGAPPVRAIGNAELAVKIRFLRQAEAGWDIAVFPRVFLPSASRRIGEQHAAVLVPFFLEQDWGKWSTFGGGGCALNRGGESQDYCLMSWALAHQILPKLQIGLEIYHQTPDVRGGRQATGLNAGLRYDMTEHIHLLGSFGPGLQNAADTNRNALYAAVLATF